MYSSVTHIFSHYDRGAVAEHIECTVRQSVSQAWAPGWPGEIEAALLDAVFSSRAPYGRPDTGVRRVITRWREYRNAAFPDSIVLLDDLTALVDFGDRPDELAELLGNRQRVAGNSTTKAEAAVRAAATLSSLGVQSARHLADNDDHRAAVTAIAGIGDKTWECLLFVAGIRTVDARELLRSFASDAVGRELDASTTAALLESTAEMLGIRYPCLEHAAWRYQRRFGITVSAPTAAESD